MSSQHRVRNWALIIFWGIFASFSVEEYASGAPVSKQGTLLNYVCKSGPKKKCSTLIYGERGAQSNLTTDCGENGIDSDVEVWHYISGLFGYATEGSVLKVMTVKSGDLDKANIPIEGNTYKGVVNFWDRRGSFDMNVEIEVGKILREKTTLGSQNILPITTTIRNSDGKGGTATVLVKYSPAVRVKIEEKYTGAFPERGWDCVLSNLKLNQLNVPDKSLKLELPPAGVVLKYQCEGKVKTRELKVMSNATGRVKYSVVRDGSASSDFTADSWQLYAGLAREIVTSGKKPLLMDVKGDELNELTRPLKLGSYRGRVMLSGLAQGDYALRLAIHPKRIYDSAQFGKVDVIPVNGYRSGGLQEVMRTQYLYSEQMKAPVWYRVQERHDATRNQECRLISHSGFPAKK